MPAAAALLAGGQAGLSSAWQLARCQEWRTAPGMLTAHPAGSPPSPATVHTPPGARVKIPVPAPSWNPATARCGAPEDGSQ